MIWIWLLRKLLLGDNAYLSTFVDVHAVTEEQKLTKIKIVVQNNNLQTNLSRITFYKKGIPVNNLQNS